MSTTLIRLEDGTLVEVDVEENKIQPMSGSMAKRVNTNIKHIKPIIVNTCDPIIESLEEVKNKSLIDTVEVVISLGFEGEGNLFLAKAKGNANISIKLKFSPNNQS